jgi:2-keto-4-pentenoate hydratase/2-oxohepta-3-ene-1,7-dioic acid hydratase in catechol pathway
VQQLTIPKYPVIFTKPADALAGPETSIRVRPDAQGMLDYEAELTAVVKRDVKNLPASGHFSLSHYVLGYTAGNDVSSRNFQLLDVSGGQYCYAKSFDGFSPIGPVIVSSDVVPDPQKLAVCDLSQRSAEAINRHRRYDLECEGDPDPFDPWHHCQSGHCHHDWDSERSRNLSERVFKAW